MTDQVSETTKPEPISFKAETRQLLNILIHSLYTEREIFLRELVSNASDALTRMNFEQLTNRDVLDPDLPLEIRIRTDPEQKILEISDTGIGMTAGELTENLGTIAHSGARSFLEAAKDSQQDLSNLIGQFGVGFYSAFMVAEWIRVTSRSFRPEAEAAAWFSTGSDTYHIEPAEREKRGTTVTVKLKEDAAEYAEASRLRDVIRRHSDFIPYPIYLNDETEQVNRQTALWRQSPRDADENEYAEFYKQFTLDFEEPLAHAHMVVDAPVQMYALLFVPNDPERSMFSPRKEDGLKLYARKVLIQEYNKDLLPEYFGFIEGVVDSEDLPLNISRESVQSNRVMATLKKLVTAKVTETLESLAKNDPEKYARFWENFGRYVKQGVAVEQTAPEKLYSLLRFRTSTHPEEWSSLEDYLARMPEGQKDIYYILGEDRRSVVNSPHLDAVKRLKYEVLLLTEPVDPFMLVRMTEYKDHPLTNVAKADLDLPEDETEQPESEAPAVPEEQAQALVDRFKEQLGERVAEVRMTGRLTGSPARLVDPEGALNQEMQRVYRFLNREFEVPKKVLELNPRHPIILRLNELPKDSELSPVIIEQVYENALLIEGLHPDPAGMIGRIQTLMQAALDRRE